MTSSITSECHITHNNIARWISTQYYIDKNSRYILKELEYSEKCDKYIDLESSRSKIYSSIEEHSPGAIDRFKRRKNNKLDDYCLHNTFNNKKLMSELYTTVSKGLPLYDRIDITAEKYKTHLKSTLTRFITYYIFKNL